MSTVDREITKRPFVTFLDKDGRGVRQPFENDKEQDEFVHFNEDNGTYNYVDGGSVPLHSIDGQVALYESKYERKHHMYKGVLHRIEGPAFECKYNSYNAEYYVFGIHLGEHDLPRPIDFLIKYRKYLMKLEEYIVSTKTVPSMFGDIWTLSSLENLQESAGTGQFRWSENALPVYVMEENPAPLEDLFVEPEPEMEVEVSTPTGLTVGLAALSVAALSAISLKKRTKTQSKVRAHAQKEQLISK